MEKVAELEGNMSIWSAHPDELIEQDVNPQVMPQEMFDQLSRNIKTRGALEQLPYGHMKDGKLTIISGHHRVRAARAAGLPLIYILVDESDLTRDQEIAKQLAHNQITGEPDPDILRDLYLEIDDMNARIEAYVDLDSLDNEHDILTALPSLRVPPEWETVVFQFLPHQIEAFDWAVDRLMGDEVAAYHAPFETYEEFVRVLKEVKGVEKVKHTGMAIARMCEIVSEYIESKKRKEE